MNIERLEGPTPKSNESHRSILRPTKIDTSNLLEDIVTITLANINGILSPLTYSYLTL